MTLKLNFKRILLIHFYKNLTGTLFDQLTLCYSKNCTICDPQMHYYRYSGGSNKERNKIVVNSLMLITIKNNN